MIGRWTAALAGALLATAASAQLGDNPPSPLPDGLKAGTGAPFPKGNYAALNALPDLGGIWILKVDFKAPRPPKPKLKGKYKAAYEAWLAEISANNGEAKKASSNCIPPGMPRFMQMAQYPYEFLLTPGRVTINQEAWMQTRTIWTDGRRHVDDPDPSFGGDAIGHWDKGALIADTIAIKTSLELAPGMTHSDKLRVEERIALTPGNPDLLTDELTFIDPDALEEPYHITMTYRRDRYGKLIEFECSENDRNPVDAKGNTTFSQ